jgi:hypothetical protein
LPPEIVQHRLEEHQDLGDRIERERLERGGELAELRDGGGAAGGDGGERVGENAANVRDGSFGKPSRKAPSSCLSAQSRPNLEPLASSFSFRIPRSSAGWP